MTNEYKSDFTDLITICQTNNYRNTNLCSADAYRTRTIILDFFTGREYLDSYEDDSEDCCWAGGRRPFLLHLRSWLRKNCRPELKTLVG